MNQVLQYNYITNNNYQGQNQVDLLDAKKKFGYKSDAWVTFLQAASLGLKVKKGSKAIAIFKGYGSFVEVNEETNKITNHTRPLGIARVFNMDQTEKRGDKDER